MWIMNRDALTMLSPSKPAKDVADQPTIVEAVPSAAAIKRHGPDGKYDGIACTCAETCEYACTGKCGCAACSSSYGDSMEYDF